jgi:hypothetical protein
LRAKSLLIVAVNIFLFAAEPLPAQPQGRCTLQASLRHEISKKYPTSTVVTLANLDQYDRKLFQKDHGNLCPGLVKVNFYGDGKPTWAVLLIPQEKSNGKAELIVTHRVGTRWEIRSLETTDASPVPVIWREGPGKYDDISDPKTIRATRPVIVLCGYEAWARLYAWTGREVEMIQISD